MRYAIILLLLVTGCAQNFVRPDRLQPVNQRELDRDLTDCQSKKPEDMLGVPAQRFIARCMSGKGWDEE